MTELKKKKKTTKKASIFPLISSLFLPFVHLASPSAQYLHGFGDVSSLSIAGCWQWKISRSQKHLFGAVSWLPLAGVSYIYSLSSLAAYLSF